MTPNNAGVTGSGVPLLCGQCFPAACEQCIPAAVAAVAQRTRIADQKPREARGGWRRPGPIRATLLAVLGLCAFAPSPVRAQPVEWTPFQPSLRYDHAMAYDADRGVTVMVGNGETWEWNGTVWARRLVSGPSPRQGHAMAYDAARGVTVLFGGLYGNNNGETWEWDGTAWTRRLVSGPSPRHRHAMTYDAGRGVTVLFGGRTGAYPSYVDNDETWEWNGTTWTQRMVSGPTARYGHAMAYDAVRGVTVLFGGRTGTTPYNGETWEWNGTVWTQRLVTGPSPRYGHTMVYDSVHRATMLFGGTTEAFSYSSQSWEWDGTAWIQRMVSGPMGRYYHAMAFDAARGVAVLFGGNLGRRDQFNPEHYSGDTWEWDGNGWLFAGPSPRYGHAMAYDSARGVTVLFGGYLWFGGDVYLGETLEWNAAAWTQRMVSGPSRRSDHAMAYDAARGVTVLFGGRNGSVTNGETWEWNGTTWTQRLVSGPSPRGSHAMSYDSARGVAVLYGGSSSAGSNGESWEWNGIAWTQRMVTGPSPRSQHAMAYDAARGVTVLFGGYTSTGFNGETWEWNGTTWTQRVVSGPSARGAAAMAYDAAHGVTVLSGGANTSGHYGGTWEWNGLAWQERVISGPSARREHAMAYDSVRGVTVLFGGIYSNPVDFVDEYRGDTWHLGAPCVGPSVIAQPTAQTVCLGGSASFTVGAAGTDTRTYRWWKGTSALVDEPNHISGATAATLVIVNTTEADEGSYNCIVTNACGVIESNAAALSVCDYPADLNCDAQVGISDLAILLSNFGRSDSPPHSDGDLDGDGEVSLADLAIMLNGFGEACP